MKQNLVSTSAPNTLWLFACCIRLVLDGKKNSGHWRHLHFSTLVFCCSIVSSEKCPSDLVVQLPSIDSGTSSFKILSSTGQLCCGVETISSLNSGKVPCFAIFFFAFISFAFLKSFSSLSINCAIIALVLNSE